MAWNSTYAAFRYFRRAGATITKKDRIIILPIHKIIDARCKEHKATLEGHAYSFTTSLFTELCK